jgi:putative ABC transport system ATP-binding protein
MYELKGVSKLYHKGQREIYALRDVALSVADGDFLTIQGPTGSGKTTLLLLLGALDRPTSGSVVLDGTDTGRLGEGALCDLRARTLGFVFQNYNLLPTLTAAENVQAALVPLGVSGSEGVRRSKEALADVGLADRSGHYPTEMSGGEQQRVAIARALVKHPRVLLADEPTGNLDEGTKDEIVALLEGLRASKELTLIVATHDTKIARHALRTAMIQKGQLSLRQNRAVAASPATASAPAAASE